MDGIWQMQTSESNSMHESSEESSMSLYVSIWMIWVILKMWLWQCDVWDKLWKHGLL